jgi:hypothetical protein
MTVTRGLATQLEIVPPGPEPLTVEMLEAALARGQVLALTAAFPLADDTTVTYRVRSARRAVELLHHLRVLGLRPVACLEACDVPNPHPTRTGRLVQIQP